MSTVSSTTEYPAAPGNIEDLGVPTGIVEDIILQRLVIDGRSSVAQMSAAIGISVGISDAVIDGLRQRLMLEIQGMAGRDYVIVPTDKGKAEAASRSTSMMYASYCPVSLGDYNTIVNGQQGRSAINEETLNDAFHDLIIEPGFFEQLGPALVSKGAVFLYGPPGTGKTSLAERMIKMYKDPVLIPRAVEYDMSIITVFDPSIHNPVEQPAGLDPRWVLCERPFVLVGGELTSEHLDLQRDQSTGIYRAPLQMKANNGIFVIDDFGRQKTTPEALLNRWIVPLSRSVDYLTLAHGASFQIPFDAKVVFSTNMRPDQLGDDAFARRIPNKVFVGQIEASTFDRVLVAVCKAMGISCDQESADYLKTFILENSEGGLRPYFPADFCKTLTSICDYEGREKTLDVEAINRVAKIYFTRDDAAGHWETKAQVAA